MIDDFKVINSLLRVKDLESRTVYLQEKQDYENYFVDGNVNGTMLWPSPYDVIEEVAIEKVISGYKLVPANRDFKSSKVLSAVRAELERVVDVLKEIERWAKR